MSISALVTQAAEVIAPVWPLETFIACNPLQGLESLSFEDAITQARGLFRNKAVQLAAFDDVNQATIKWCTAFLDHGQAALSMPGRELGLYAAFQRLAPHDATLTQGDKVKKNWLKQLPNTPDAAIAHCLAEMQVLATDQEAYIRQSLVQLPGWAGYVKWRSDWQDANGLEANQHPLSVLDFVALRLVIQCVLGPKQFIHTEPTYHDSRLDQINIQQLVYREGEYKQRLVKQLMANEALLKQPKPGRMDVQMVFCIDVRSEPFRRCFEALGAYETFGFAGFFALPVRIHPYADPHAMDCCPVLLKPAYDVHCEPTQDTPAEIARYHAGQRFLHHAADAYHRLKYNMATPFALVETLGLWCGVSLLLKTVSPVWSTAFIQGILDWIKPPLHTEPRLDEGSMPLSVQVDTAEAMLRFMGLTRNFAKLVILCGHGSTTQNNPYASSLDCGACGGNHGGANADIMAVILNTKAVRELLAQRGLDIPQDTVFIAAEHNTTTDEVVLHTHASTQHTLLLQRVKRDLATAAKQNTHWRVSAFGSHSAPVATQDVIRRASDWAEVRPEWGLARNAAFIVAPRALSQAIDLDGRCFLHSYDYTQDEDGVALETILTAPMVVAQWINTQYLFSTLDNVAFGSGSKITHNVVGQFGVMQGNGSDLMHGLPMQSVNRDDLNEYHIPQRLITVVYAPRQRVEMLIARHEILQRLFYKGWVKLVVIEPLDSRAYRLGRTGSWDVIAG